MFGITLNNAYKPQSLSVADMTANQIFFKFSFLKFSDLKNGVAEHIPEVLNVT